LFIVYLTMPRLLLAFILFCPFLSCNYTKTNSGQLFVNQQLIESSIQAVQPAEHIYLSVRTTNDRDSVLIVQLTVDPKIPDDSLNAHRAKLVLSSFLAILPSQSLTSLTSCKIVFLKTSGSLISKSRSIAFTCPITADLTALVANYKDSTKTDIGYIDPNWTYINKDLKLSLTLKSDWSYASEEHDSILYYTIGSDINQLPQYRTDSNRKVTFLTLQKMAPAASYTVLQLYNTNDIKETASVKYNYQGPLITAGLILNNFDSEDEYMKNLYEMYFSKKLPDDEIHSYNFGNAVFRGHQLSRPDKNGRTIYLLSVIKRFRKVSLVLNMKYTDNKEYEEIKSELSGLKIN
jgi:hypothetical protein